MNSKKIKIGIVTIILLMGTVFLAGCDEEEGTRYDLDEICDKTFENGVHLYMYYDMQNNSFIGTVENTLNITLKEVRVEVHLSNEEELGPTTPVDLLPGETHDVLLNATSTDFEWWSVHPEVKKSAEFLRYLWKEYQK